jgi:hypothetical protein
VGEIVLRVRYERREPWDGRLCSGLVKVTKAGGMDNTWILVLAGVGRYEVWMVYEQ